MSGDSPLVSVILPVRDGGEFLREAVDSILAQTHRHLELLLVDDGSTDGAVDRLPVIDARLRVIRRPAGGVVAAFNAGLAGARGEFVARMDADDIALPRRLEEQLALLARRPGVDIAGARVELFAEGGIEGGNRRYQDWLNALTEPDQIARELFIESPVPNPTALFRRAALERLGGYRDTRWPEDYDLFLRADALGMAMAKPEPVLLRWRDHPGRLTRLHARYRRRRFQQAKAHYLARGRLANGAHLVWGAGPTGRDFHDLLAAEGVALAGFVEVHPRRIGGRKRDLPVWPVEKATAWEDGCVLVAVGARGARRRIREFLDTAGRQEGSDYLCVA